MTVNDRTTNFSLALPHVDNDLEDDVTRLREALVNIDDLLASNETIIFDRGVVASGGAVAFDFARGDYQSATFQTGAATVAFSGFTAGANCLMLLQLNNAGLATITFPAINWVVPDGTYTTNIATYLTAIGRPSLSATMPTWMLVWSNNGTTFYGKIL